MHAELESPLPAFLEAGRATAIFCFGACFDGAGPLRGLEILVDGERHRPAAWRMPRPDVHARLHGAPGSYRSGFWGTVTVPSRPSGETVALEVAVVRESGEELVLPLARVEVREDPAAPLSPRPAADGEPIGVCMATHNPEPLLFRAQIESLRAQTDRAWVCVISDDCSDEASLGRMLETLGDDPRFALSRSERRLGFYRNFERAIRLAPPAAPLLALCDQDDRWHPSKLATLRARLGGAALVYSDQRLVRPNGEVLGETLWEGRDRNEKSMASMLVANSITGAASLFRRDVAEAMLPFPHSPGLQFHDHWLGLVALAAGDIAFVDEPLYDYVQHGGAVFSEVSLGAPAAATRGIRGRIERWRIAYFYGYLGREVQAQALLARFGDRLEAEKRRDLERFIAADRSVAALAWLGGRSLRRFAGRSDTLGSESELAAGPLWRRLVGARAGRRQEPGSHPVHASFPPVGPEAFEQRRLRRWRAGRISSGGNRGQ